MSTILSRRTALAFLCFLSFGSESLAAVGRTPGTFDVTSTGAGTYAIEVAVPPGTNRLTPRVALVYTSRSDNGILGMGWDIAGLSAIARCAKTIAQDNEVRAVLLDSQDAFCLDGNRLRPTAGSTYQTEVETFSLITASGTAGNGPASFEVKRKDGLIAEYGNSSDSRIEVLGSSTPRVWALSKIKDRSGNYIEFVYYEDMTNGSYRPFEIRYTGNALKGETPKYKLVFVYEARPGSEDPLIEYFAGGKIKELNRLNRIEVQHESALVWKYQFAYESIGSPPRSLLDSVQRCATVSDCLEPTVFDYQDGVAGWASTDSAVSGLTLSSIAYAMPGDANGDGFEDLFFFDTSIAKWDVVWGGASGFGLVVSTGYGSATYQFQALPIDLDSDGKRDLLVPNGANWWWLRLDSNGNWQFSDTGAPADGASGSAWVIDVDGDSREDVVWGWNSRQIRWRKNTSSGGSGSLDSTYTTAWTGGQFEFFNTNPFGTTAKTFRQISRVADFNGDNRGVLRTA